MCVLNPAMRASLRQAIRIKTAELGNARSNCLRLCEGRLSPLSRQHHFLIHHLQRLEADMPYYPSLPEYLELARDHSVVPIYRQLLGDTLTPVTAFHKIQGGHWTFLFESVVGGERLGRYSFLGAEPFLTFQAWDRRVRIDDPRTGAEQELQHSDPLRLLEEWLDRFRGPNLPGLPRFSGGAVGYAGYDTVRYVERLEHPPADDRKLPDLSFA